MVTLFAPPPPQVVKLGGWMDGQIDYFNAEFF